MFRYENAISLLGKEHRLPNVSKLSHSAFAELVKRRAFCLFDANFDGSRITREEAERRKTERNIEEYYARITQGAEPLPKDFLYNKAQADKVICRISRSASFGGAILIAKGLLITNHHILPTAEQAAGSLAEFDYSANRRQINVALRPDKLFVSQADLDFTIVACDTDGIEDLTPLKLLRNPVTITRHEALNVLQASPGNVADSALQNCRVVYVYDRVIHYETAAFSTVSGSGLFNNSWELCALQRAAWQADNKPGTLVNEGIRIASIVARLNYLAETRNQHSAAARQILGQVDDSSPYLGFYDVCGLLGNDPAPGLELSDWAGDGRFADIGFWNIENFNDRVSERRINKVADIIARLSMDVLGLNEVEKTSLDALKLELRNRGHNMDYVFQDADFTHDLAILYDVETTKVHLRHDINRRYADVLSMRTKAGYTAFPGRRYPLFAQCVVQEEGKDAEFLMIVVHLKAQDDKSSRERRRLAANILSVIIEELRERENLAIVLGGDFNQELDGQVLSDLTDSPDLFTLTADDAHTDAISYLGGRNSSLIDHIIISKDLQIGQIAGDDAAIIRFDKSIKNFARDISDHVPLVLRLILRKAPLLTLGSGSIPDNSLDWTKDQPQDFTTCEKALAKLRIKAPRTRRTTDNNHVGASRAPSPEVDAAYYDAKVDAELMEAYYAVIDWSAGDLFGDLNNLLQKSHAIPLTYAAARYKHLYVWVDLQPNGRLKSIYSGQELEPEEVIRREYASEQRRHEALNRLVRSKAQLSEAERKAQLKTIESEHPFYCEHVVPQSWFNRADPMRSDLHHLFTCEPHCNLARSTFPFFNFSEQDSAVNQAISQDCGKRAVRKFEPRAGKGAVARATLYFLLRYPGLRWKYKAEDLEVLRNWHRQFPVSLFERHRNKAIFEAQGNRNPLIDKAEMIEKIDFSKAL